MERVNLGEIEIVVIRKAVKNVHLSVHPPDGHVTLVAPEKTRLEVARAYAVTKLPWIREQRRKILAQARESERRYVRRESHYLWGHLAGPHFSTRSHRLLLDVVETNQKPCVKFNHRRITLSVRPHSTELSRAALVHRWHLALLHEVIPGLIAQWEPRLGVKVNRYFLQRMKTKWGSCTPSAGTIRLNTELVKKPRELLEYVVVHEMVHLLEPTHNSRFVALMDQHFPSWREARQELNALPLGAEKWNRAT